MAKNPAIACKQSTFRLGCVLTLAAVLAGCDAHNSSRTELIGYSSSDGMSIWAPEFILSSRALDIDTIDLEVRVNGEIVQTQRVGDSWEASFEIAAGTPYDLSIIWTDESGLLLAQLNSTQPGVQSSVSQITIRAGQYVSSGSSLFDVDGDDFSNLEEIGASSDPRDPDNTPQSPRPLPPPASVVLQRILPEDAPTIDGNFDTIWNSAQYLDTERNELAIDNILCSVDSTTGCRDGAVGFQWAGMHDDINLYLYIFGESDTDPNRKATNDSEILFHDDSVELFFDGNNSRGQSYDGVDDTHIIIALQDAAAEAFGRITRGTSDSVPIPEGIRFRNCDCSPTYTFEISIPLSSLNITPGQAFGMEVQLNDDNDGGNRDSYWGWFQTSSSNATFYVPAVMGSATLGTEFR